jgi:OOP family OmpA-OmpF porin
MMGKSRFGLAVSGALLAMVMAAPSLAQQQEIKGIIVTNQDGQLTLTTPSGNQVVSIGAADIRSIAGPLGRQRRQMPATALISGLPVSIVADNSSGKLVASKIEYKASDYKTAAQIQAGVEATAIKAESAVTALSKVGQWNVQAETAVYFANGSSVVTPAGKKDLAHIAKQAQGYQGYMISVLGYASPTGNAAFNQRLSAKRAQTVINFLKQQPGIQPARVLSASAMGQVNYSGAASPSTFASDRRVNVRVVTSAAQLPAQ